MGTNPRGGDFSEIFQKPFLASIGNIRTSIENNPIKLKCSLAEVVAPLSARASVYRLFVHLSRIQIRIPRSLVSRHVLVSYLPNSSASSPICLAGKQSIGHILNGCQTALSQGRFTYRHDAVLRAMLTYITKEQNYTTWLRTMTLRTYPRDTTVEQHVETGHCHQPEGGVWGNHIHRADIST